MKYCVSHKGCTIIYDDKKRHSDSKEWEEVVESYLKGMTKLVVAVDRNDDWTKFGQLMTKLVAILKRG